MTSLCDLLPSGHWVFEGNGYILLIFGIPSTRHDHPVWQGRGGGRMGGKKAFLVAQMVKNLPAMQDTWVWSLGQEDPLEESRATHFSDLAWKIPRIEEPGGLQSMGSQRVRHDWVTKTFPRQGRGFKALFLGDLAYEWGLKAGSAVYYLGDFK